MLIFRYAIMSIKNEKSGGSTKTKELYELFGRSAVFLGCGEVQSGINRFFVGFWPYSKRRGSSQLNRCCLRYIVLQIAREIDALQQRDGI